MINPKVEILAPSEQAFYASTAALADRRDEKLGGISLPTAQLPSPLPRVQEGARGQERHGTDAAIPAEEIVPSILRAPEAPLAPALPMDPLVGPQKACLLLSQGQAQHEKKQHDLLQFSPKSLFPVYLPVTNVPSKVIKDAISQLLSLVSDLPDILPTAIIQSRQLLRTSSSPCCLDHPTQISSTMLCCICYCLDTLSP